MSSASSLVALCCALILLSASSLSFAQSGRRQQQSGKSPVPSATPTAPDAAASKSVTAKVDTQPSLSFVVLSDEGLFMDVPRFNADDVYESFVRRLGQAKAVTVVAGGRSDRRRARERAKTEKDTHVVLVQLEEEMTGGSMRGDGQVDLNDIVVSYYVYTPTEATLKAQGRVRLRPAQATARVGGVRVPVPSPRGGLPLEYVFEQAGRDAADRVLAAFQVPPPPDSPLR